MLLEIRRELLVDDGLHRALDFRVAELGLGLTLELRLAHLHRKNRGQPFTNVVAAQREVRLFQSATLRRVSVDRPRQRRLQAGEVCSALMVLMLLTKEKTFSL